VISFNDVVTAWDAAPFDAIHPTRAVSEAEYEASGQEQADALAAVLPHGTVLDFGCGDGRVAIPLAAHGFKVIGADASPRMCEALRARDEHVPTIVSDGSNLAEQLDRKVDAVICLAVLIHHDHEGGKADPHRAALGVAPGRSHDPALAHPGSRLRAQDLDRGHLLDQG